MTHSGDAAEQIVRMSLEGVEVAARITGTAAKEVALLLLAALKSPDKGAAGRLKLKGKERLTSMLKSGKALEIFSVRERDLKKFVQEAKRYGIVYCVLRNSKNAPDGLCDIMVKAEDAPKINRLVERFKFAAVDKVKIENEIVQERNEPTAGIPAEPTASSMDGEIPPDDAPTEAEAPEINDVDALLDELLGTDEGKTAPEAEKAATEKPTPEKIELVKHSPKRAERGSKKEPAPPVDERKELPLASGGEGRTARPAKGSPIAENPSKGSPPPKASPSEPSSESRRNSEKRFSRAKKPSVKEELREIAAAKKAEADAPVRDDALTPIPTEPKELPAATHKQPPHGKKPKSEKTKGR